MEYMGHNILKQETSWNNWNHLEQSGKSWNYQKLALERGMIVICGNSFEARGSHMSFLKNTYTLLFLNGKRKRCASQKSLVFV